MSKHGIRFTYICIYLPCHGYAGVRGICYWIRVRRPSLWTSGGLHLHVSNVLFDVCGCLTTPGQWNCLSYVHTARAVRICSSMSMRPFGVLYDFRYGDIVPCLDGDRFHKEIGPTMIKERIAYDETNRRSTCMCSR